MRKFHIIQPVVVNQKKRSPGRELQLQRQRLLVLDDDPAVPVHDPLRQPGGAGGVEHPERVVERDRLVGELAPLLGERLPAHRVLDRLADGQDGRAQRRQLLAERRDGRADVEALAAVDIAVDGEQHGGLDLGEPVVHGAGPEVRRARRPDRAEAGRGQERHERLDAVGRQRDHPVAATDPERDESRPRPADELAQLTTGDRALEPVLAGVDQRGVGVAAGGEGLLGVVQRGTGEPPRPGHLPGTEDGGGRGVEADVEVLDEGRPEAVEVGDRPLVQRGVVVDRDALVLPEPVGEAGERSAVVGCGSPQDVGDHAFSIA